MNVNKKVDIGTNTLEKNPNADGKVMEGRNNRLFIANDTNNVLKQHLGEMLLSAKELIKLRRTIELRKAYCHSKGIEYLMLISPDTHAIYKEDIQALDGEERIRPVIQLFESLDNYNNIVYPLKELREAKSEGEVCHPVDSHWTGFGAYIAYKSLLQKSKLKLNILNSDDIETFEKISGGDLGDKFTPAKEAKYTECVVRAPSSRKVWNNELKNRGHMSLWKNKDRKKPRCILITDSYGWKIQRFFAESFSDLIILHNTIFEFDAIEKYNPDFVITLTAERFLRYIPNDLNDKNVIDFAMQQDTNASYIELDKLIEPSEKSKESKESKLISENNKLTELLNSIKKSKSYKLGHTLAKPYWWIKNKVT